MQEFCAARRWLAALILVLPVCTLQAAPPASSGWASRPEVVEFVREMVDKHGFDQAGLIDVFDRTRTADLALKLIAPPPATGKRSWSAYRARFVEPVRIRDGLRFWREQALGAAGFKAEAAAAMEQPAGCEREGRFSFEKERTGYAAKVAGRYTKTT